MFSASDGVAIATFWNKNFTSLRHSYLTTTVNGGTSWRITGVLPTGSWNPLRQGTALIAFASPLEGYIEQPAPRGPLFTADGGRTWKSVAFAGAITSLSLSHGRIIVSAARCHNGSDTCTTRIGVIRPGSLTPTSDTVIPTLSDGSKVPPEVLATLGPTVLALEGATLIATSDSGASWRRITNPCPGAGYGPRRTWQAILVWVHAVRTGCGNDEGVSTAASTEDRR